MCVICSNSLEGSPLLIGLREEEELLTVCIT